MKIFDSEAFIKEMESLEGISKESDKFDYDFDIEEYEAITERDLKGDM